MEMIPPLPSVTGLCEAYLEQKCEPGQRRGCLLEIIPAHSEGSAMTNKNVGMRRALFRKSGSDSNETSEVSRAQPF